jgi:putative Holliday junction resolvase
MRRLLGIDYGTARIGIALSDEGGTIAFPYAVYPNDSEVISLLKKLKDEEEVGGIVVGESKNFQGEDNAIMEKIRKFAKKLEAELSLPVYFEPEFLTTVQVKHNERADMRDAQAAAIILQSFLDKKNNAKK